MRKLKISINGDLFLLRSFTHWPRGVVPFKWDSLLSEEIRNLTLSAMFYISSLSCVKFEAADENSKNFVFITKGPGCSSAVGNLRQGQQNLKLSHLCERGNIIHELLHTLGFLHMHVSEKEVKVKGFFFEFYLQTAPQRDDYVKIVYGNVEPQALKNFEKYTAYVSMFNTQYDYRSIMHYRREAFGVDKDKPTIIPFEPVKSMGQRQSKQTFSGLKLQLCRFQLSSDFILTFLCLFRTEMSEGDITRLNRYVLQVSL